MDFLSECNVLNGKKGVIILMEDGYEKQGKTFHRSKVIHHMETFKQTNSKNKRRVMKIEKKSEILNIHNNN